MKYQGPRWETPVPPGVTGSYGPQARKWAKAKLGIECGRWQRHVIDAILRHDKRGDIIARHSLISTGRQNGKSVVVRVIIGWLLDEGQYLPAFASWTTLLAAAHDAKQARIIYKGVYADLWNIPEMRARASGGARKGQDVRLTEHFGISVGKLSLDTITGQPGSARGRSAGLIAFDEVLTQRDFAMMEAVVPVQAAQRSPFMILTSTAGHADSVVLRSFYDRLVRQSAGDEAPDPAFYGAWWQSEGSDAGLDWQELQRANPSLGDGRLTRQAIATEYAILPADSWQRERLNHFVDVIVPGAFNPGVWAACRVAEPLAGLEGPYALGIDVQPGWERATIAVAGVRGDGRIGVEVFKDLRDGVTAERIVAELAKFPDAIQTIAYDGVSGAAPTFRRDATETGRPWDELKPAGVVSACMDVVEMIQSRRLAVDDPLIDAQIPLAARRDVGQDGAFRFSRQGSLGPIDAVMAMTMAAHAIANPARYPQIFL